MRLMLYHATSAVAANSIREEGRLRPGTHGFAGGAIYFSERESAACRKYRNGQGNPEVVIRCDVNLGTIVKAEKFEMDKVECERMGGNSVKINNLDVFAVYDHTRIKILAFTILRPESAFSLPNLLELEQEEIQQQEDLERRYADWGRGHILCSSSGVAQGALALREARLAHFGSYPGFGKPTAKADNNELAAAHVNYCGSATSVGTTSSQAHQAYAVEELRDAPFHRGYGRREKQSVSLESSHQTATSQIFMEDGDRDLQEALLLSSQHAKTQVAMEDRTCSEQSRIDPEDDELQQALLLSMQVAEEDEQLQQALAMSMNA